MKTESCTTCGKPYSPSCDYRQGRCPHHPSIADQYINDPYYARFFNLFKAIGKVFKK